MVEFALLTTASTAVNTFYFSVQQTNSPTIVLYGYYHWHHTIVLAPVDNKENSTTDRFEKL